MTAHPKSKSPAATGLSANQSYLLHCPISSGKAQYEFTPKQLHTGDCNKTKSSSLFSATERSYLI